MTRMSLVPANKAAVSWWCQLDSSDDLSVWGKDTFLYNYGLDSQKEQTTGYEVLDKLVFTKTFEKYEK